jgi:hypothetical protein
MSTHVEPLQVVLEQDVIDEVSQASTRAASSGWTPERFASEQIRGLVQRIFLSSQPPCRQVVFSAVDPGTEIRELCLQVAQTLTGQLRRVCVVDCLAERVNGGMAGEPRLDRGVLGALRESSHQISDRLWLVPGQMFWGGSGEVWSAEMLSRRLHELRLEFDGCVMQAPATGMSSLAGLLARLSDGLILVVEAHSTRRLAAQKAQTMLRAAEVKLLGTVLSERRFPIPERLYRRL